MQETLLLVGITCAIGAIVGGGLKVVNVELPLVASVGRQVLLALVGDPLVVASFTLPRVGGQNANTASDQITPVAAKSVIAQSPGATISLPTLMGEPADITLSRTAGATGTAITVSGIGFAPGETIVVRFHTIELARARADEQGAFSVLSVRVPPDWRFTGQFDFIAMGHSSLRSARAPFRVT